MSRLHGEPFAIVPVWVLEAPISDRAVRLFAVLNQKADKEGRTFPGRPKLADMLGCSVNSVDRALAELVGVDAVAIEAHFREDGSRTSNSYWIWPTLPPVGDPGPTGGGSTPPPVDPPSPTGGEAEGNQIQSDQTQMELDGGQPPPVSVNEVARFIAQSVWDHRIKHGEPVPAQKFVTVQAVARRLLKSRYEPKAIIRAMLTVPTISTGWVEGELRRSKSKRTQEEALNGSDWEGVVQGRIKT